MTPPNPLHWIEPARTLWRSPSTLTALIPVGPQSLEDVNTRLKALAPEFSCQLTRVTDLHAYRMAAIPPEKPGAPVRVLINSVHDTPLAQHVPALMEEVGTLLASALHGANFQKVHEIPALIARYRETENTFHLGAINMSVQEIKSEERLLETMEAFADQRVAAGAWKSDTPAEQIRREIREHVLQRAQDQGLPTSPRTKLGWRARLRRFFDLLVAFALPTLGVLAPHMEAAIRRIRDPITRTLAWLGYGVWWIYGGAFTGLALLFVRIVERTEHDLETPAPDPEKVARLESAEDEHLKNAVTIWFPVRDSRIRRTLVGLILWGAERGCRHFWTHGALAGIDTIHYARILQVDRGRTMLFMSDYDGSLDRYLMDFIGVGSNAVIPISSGMAGCPPVRWLFAPEDPTTFGPRWRALIRAHQLETPIWYSSYPDLSVNDILSNARLRDGLFAESLTEDEAQRWTAML